MSKRKRNTMARDKPTNSNSHSSSSSPISATDAFSNPLARLGAGTPNLLEYTNYTRTNFTADYNTLNALYRENWIVGRIVDIVAEDMTKNWYSIKSQISPESKKKISRLESRTGVRAKILEGLKWGRLYGGAAAIIVIEGQEDMLDQPLNYDLIMPGGFKGLIVVDRWSGISPGSEIVEDINDPDFGMPKYYTVEDETFGFGVKVHHSRILRFLGRSLPNLEEQMEQYWGISEIERVYSELKKYDNTGYNIAALVFSANLKVYQMDGFDQLGTLNPNALKDLYEILMLMNWMRSSQGMQVIGHKDTFSTHQYSFAGLSDVYTTFMLDVAGAAAIPVTKLFGRSPAGMNATGESDMANYYDSIEEQQEAILRPVIDRLLPIMCISEFGAIPDDLEFEFEPVRRASEEEKKNILTQVTTAVNSTFQAGIISQQIALKELRESSRITGMWNNITDEDIEKADSSFGIGGEPPDILAAIQEQVPEPEEPAESVGGEDV